MAPPTRDTPPRHIAGRTGRTVYAVAAVVLFALALLLLARWLFYTVPRVECAEPVPRAGAAAPAGASPCGQAGPKALLAPAALVSRRAARATSPHPPKAPVPAQTPCPKVIIEEPTLDPESAMRFSLAVSVAGGDAKVKPTYRWKVSAGKIVKGQNTEAITVDVTGTRPPLRVTVSVGGYDARCRTSATFTLGGGHTLNTNDANTNTITNTNSITNTNGNSGNNSNANSSNANAQFPTPTPAPTPAPTTTPAATPRSSPTPRVRPSPAATASPAVTPSFTPAATPGPTPAATPSTAEHGRITVNRPERFLEGREDSINCELARVLEAVVASEMTQGGTTTTVEGVVLDIFDPRYTPEAAFVFESDDLQLVGGDAGGHPAARPKWDWKSLEAARRAHWDWRVKLVDAARPRVSFTLRLHVRMLPKEEGLDVVVMRNIWQRRFEDIPTGLPADVRAAKYGAPLSAAGGLALLGVYGLPGRRRRLEEELAREEAAGAEPGATAQQDEVKFSVFAPAAAAPSDSFLVQVFAHLASQLAELAARAAEADPAASKRGTAPVAKPVARGTGLTVCLRMDDFEIDEPAQALTWQGEVEQAQFLVTVPEGRRAGSVVGVVTVLQESVPVGHLKFVFRVAPGGEPAQPATAATTPAPLTSDFVRYRRAFISYASQDRPEVLKRVQMLDRLGVPYFQDLLTLEPGQRWESELYRYIDDCDVFYLFWSNAAKRSEWVEKEVRHALRRQGGSHDAPPEIVPVIIEGPPLVPPPDYLAALHFNDKILYFIEKESNQ